MKLIVSALLLWAVTCVAQEASSITEQPMTSGQEEGKQSIALANDKKGKYAIIGTVIDRTTQEPVAGAKVTVLGTKITAQTAGDGQYAIESLSEGIFQIKAEAPGYEPQIFNNVAIGQQRQKERLFFTLNKSTNMPPPDFIPVEKFPTPIYNPAPVYPDSARRAKIEGTVWVKVWVDEQGKPKKAQVIKSDNDIFNQPAVEAAVQWTFKPAMLHDKPVAVWVSIPFKFKLEPKPADTEAPSQKKP